MNETAPHDNDDRNISRRLSKIARRLPGGLAIVSPADNLPADQVDPHGERSYDAITFGELERQVGDIALGLHDWGVRPGMRMVMLVPFGPQFITLALALLRAGVVAVLVDPGMGRKNLVRCIAGTNPDGFVGIPKAQIVRLLLRHKFPKARWNVTVGRRLFWGGRSLDEILKRGAAARSQRENATPRERNAGGLEKPSAAEDALGDEITCNTPITLDDIPHPAPRSDADPAAIIFTTGSTGPPKGVCYAHGTFNAQVDRIRERYEIKTGSRDLACFPLFGLFDAVMGVTTIIPDMDPTRPADVDPRRVVQAVRQWEVNQSFGSPALWNTVSRWCENQNESMPTLQTVLSAGAPVPADTL
ncbi:MAG: AMP-binding protein, partial [Planctomycetota bacterium]